MARKRREQITPELTPLIDVVFLLLIFFLVSSVFKKEEFALLLNLPVTEQGEGAESKTKEITIEINNDDIAVNGKKIAAAELESTLSTYDKAVSVNIRADEEARYKRLIQVLEVLQKQKKENISLITDKKK